MKQYLDLLRLVRAEGFARMDRTGVGTHGVFGAQAKFDLRKGFPLLTTKRVHIRSILHELLWFLKGDTNIKYLHEHQVTIWDEWADPEGDLGRIYGAQWRDWIGPKGEHIDQITEVLERLRTKPDDRRLIVTSWQPGEIEEMALPPCHCLYQFSTQPLTTDERQEVFHGQSGNLSSFATRCYMASDEDMDGYGVPKRRLHLQLYQRSCDLFLGVPFNIASYAFLLEMVAHVLKMQAGTFTHTYGDLHIYDNHVEQVEEQLSRPVGLLPSLEFARRVDSLFDFRFEDFLIEDYHPLPPIKAPIAV